MAKAVALVSALCVLAVAAVAVSHAHRNEEFDVEGDVYCDPCRVQFQTELSTKLPGATVKLECVNTETKAVTYSVEGATDAQGHYKLRVQGDHENDTCQVKAVKSPRADCSEPMNEVEESQIDCTGNSGIHSDLRLANPVGFMTKVADGRCVSVLQDFLADDD